MPGLIPAPVGPTPAVMGAAPPPAAEPESQGWFKTFMSDPSRLQMALLGLNLATSKTAPQQGQAVGLLNRALWDRAAWERDKGTREEQAALRKAQLEKMKQENEASAAYKALLGTEPGARIPGDPNSEAVPGSGYLSGNMSASEFATRMAGIPGYETAGVGLLVDQMDTASDNAAKVGPFKDYKDFHQAQRELAKDYAKNADPHRNAMRQYGVITDILGERGGFEKMTGADDVTLIKSYVKMVTPKESVMSDDVVNVIQASGLPGSIASYVAAFKGEGQLGPEQRAQIYQTMTNLYGSASTELRDIRAGVLPTITASAFDPAQIYRPLRMSTPYPIPSTLLGGRAAPTVAPLPTGYDPLLFNPDDPATWPPPPQ